MTRKVQQPRRNIFYSPCAVNRLAGIRPPQRADKCYMREAKSVTAMRIIRDSISLRPDLTIQAWGMGSVIPIILFRSIIKPAKSKQVSEGFYKGSQI